MAERSARAQERVRRLQRQLAAARGGPAPRGAAAGVAREETRSLRQWGGDLVAMATQSVAMTEKHGGDLVADVLKSHGVDFIFCLSGGHISPFLVAAKARGVRIVDVRHEVNAVFAADAVGRLTGKPGVAAVTAGPGVTNTVTAIKNAAMAQSPLVLLGGSAATLMQGRGALQDIDQLAFLSPIVKWAVSVRTARDIVPTLRRAFQVAASGVPGPVFVELPLDVLYPALEMLPQAGTHDRLRAGDLQGPRQSAEALRRVVVPREAAKAGMDAKAFVDAKPADAPVFVEKPASGQPSLPVRAAFSVLAARLYAGAHDTTYDLSPLPVTYPKPQKRDVARVAEMLGSARRPLFVLGSQAMLHGEAGAARLVAAIEALGVPCFLGGMSRGLLGRSSPLHIRQARGASMKESDLICLFGVVADFRLDYGRGLPGNVPIVSVNRSEEDLTKNSDLFWKPALASLADPADFVEQLASAVTSSLSFAPGRLTEWARKLKQREESKDAANRRMASEPALGRNDRADTELVNPLDLCFHVDAALGDEAILVADGGDFVATASYITRPSGPLSWLDPGAFGTLGVGGGFALGAALVRPDRQVWILWGDGSAGYSLLEFDTFVRHGVNPIAVVGNDACWTQIEREQLHMFQDDAACVLDYVDYHISARGLGAEGLLIASPQDGIADKIAGAKALAAQGRPVLINALIGRTSFREGSLSV